MSITRLWRSHRLLVIGFLLALVITLAFLTRAVVFTIYWADPSRHERSIEGWMPVRYVARSWDVPPELLAETLDLEFGARPRLTVAEIAAERQRDVDEVADLLYEAIAAHRSEGGE